ncbi:hypothetical protein RB195_015919 [Necator americanus]|uniref:Uncharacterized protein n=1 Tax=Necator americanus TaxID=51031 RepID=A0ABR1E6T0_NECAM
MRPTVSASRRDLRRPGVSDCSSHHRHLPSPPPPSPPPPPPLQRSGLDRLLGTVAVFERTRPVRRCPAAAETNFLVIKAL